MNINEVPEVITYEDIETKIEKLPEHIKPELIDFIDFLLLKYGDKINQSFSNFKFDWEGKLSELKSDYSSVDLQHKSMEWR